MLPKEKEKIIMKMNPTLVRDIWVAKCKREHIYIETAFRINAPECFFTHPVLSPDGTKVAFWGGGGNSVDIWIADLTKNKAERLTRGPGVSGHPNWSPDSKQIVLFYNPVKTPGSYFPPWGNNESKYSPRDIWIMDVETKEKTQITNDDRDNERPAWAPDGQSIVYVSSHNGIKNLWVTELTCGKSRQITNKQEVFYRPTWHPDGTRLAFNNKGAGNHYLWTVDIDGNNIRKVISPKLNPEKFHDHGAFWSRDGKEILFHSDRGGDWGIWIVGSNGKNLRQIRLPGFSHASHASWDREESLISFDAPRGTGEA